MHRIFDPRHSYEGDIHVWPDDHIEWRPVVTLLEREGFDVIVENDYLLNRRLYRTEIYRDYVDRCTDTKMMLLRKRAW